MNRRAAFRAGLALMLTGCALVLQPVGTDAATTSKSAWWSRTSDPDSAIPPAVAPPSGLVPVPDSPTPPAPRPDVPEGSLLVEGTPEGATAVAGITYLLLEGESSPVLTITPDAPVAPSSVILACRAAIDWEVPESQPGRWQDKPLVDCGRSVNGIPNDDGSVWTFALGPLVSGNDLDVILVAGTTDSAAPVGNGSAFSMRFSASEGAALASTAPPTESFSSPPTFAPSPSTSPSFGGGSSTFSPPEAPVVQPSLPAEEQGVSVPDQPQLAVQPPVAEDDTAQGVAFIILLAGAALAGWAHLTPARGDGGQVGLGRFRRPAPSEAAMAATMEPVSGGLGRFARTRTAPPPSLS